MDRIVDIAADGRHLSAYRGFLIVSEDRAEVGRVPLDDVAAVIVHAHGVQVREESVPSIVQAKQIVECIRILPIGYRTVLNLYAIEGYSHKEIADMLDIEESTSRSQYTRAKQMLEDILIRKKILAKPKEKSEWLVAIR